MHIIKTDNHYHKRNYIGSPPITSDRHNASLYTSETFVNTIVKNLRLKHPNRTFEVEPY